MLLLESIAVTDGAAPDLPAHINRMRAAQKELFGTAAVSSVPMNIPANLCYGRVKCRLLYAENIEKITYEPYCPRPVNRLILCEDPDLDYHLKYADRGRLLRHLPPNQPQSDILISRKGFITDSSFANIVLFDGKSYITPTTYLLNGIRRQQLLAAGLISERVVKVSDLSRYQTLFLINSMLDWQHKIAININCIKR